MSWCQVIRLANRFLHNPEHIFPTCVMFLSLNASVQCFWNDYASGLWVRTAHNRSILKASGSTLHKYNINTKNILMVLNILRDLIQIERLLVPSSGFRGNRQMQQQMCGTVRHTHILTSNDSVQAGLLTFTYWFCSGQVNFLCIPPFKKEHNAEISNIISGSQVRVEDPKWVMSGQSSDGQMIQTREARETSVFLRVRLIHAE